MPSMKTIEPVAALAAAAGLAASAGFAAGAAGAVVAAGAPEAGLDSAGGAAWAASPHAASRTAPVVKAPARMKRRRENAVPEIVIDLSLSVRRAAWAVALAP